LTVGGSRYIIPSKWCGKTPATGAKTAHNSNPGLCSSGMEGEDSIGW